MRVLALFFLVTVSLVRGDVALHRGVNLGNMLEAPREGAWGVALREEYFPLIAGAGFDFVRVPICWSAHAGPAPDYALDAAFFARVDWVVAQAHQNHLGVILDYHNDDDLMNFPDANGDRFLALWRQIGVHYKDAPDDVLFELLNEPHGKLDPPRWNALLARALADVRQTNPLRTVVIGPGNWNGIGSLASLTVPDGDAHLLITVHSYDPFHFTHQGASWAEGSDAWLGTKWLGTDAEKKAITDAFDQAAAWGAQHHHAIYLGEFGAFSKGDMDSRARWTAFVARTAEARGMPWSYWEFCAGFGVYDPGTKQWREPLRQALLPN